MVCVRSCSRTGVTLVELAVVLVLLGIVAALVGPALHPRRGGATVSHRASEARRRAILSGHAVTEADSAGVRTWLPDGGVLDARRDRLTGTADAP